MTACKAFERVGNYAQCLPQANQVRKAIWKAVNPRTGRLRIDEAFPHELRRKTLDNEMMIEFINGSTWQAVGSDNYGALIGSGHVGIVFSEWALSNPLRGHFCDRYWLITAAGLFLSPRPAVKTISTKCSRED